jgi:restriction endonuclease Mrr
MPLRDRALLYEPILECLHTGERPAWKIEDALAEKFKLTEAERAQRHKNSNCPVWTNDVAFALAHLIRERKIASTGKKRAPNGGTRKVYRLIRES